MRLVQGAPAQPLLLNGSSPATPPQGQVKGLEEKMKRKRRSERKNRFYSITSMGTFLNRKQPLYLPL
jgi:hypothetical protein